MVLDKRYFRYFDWISFGLTVALLGIGLLFIFSSTYTSDQPISYFFKKQLIVSGVGMLVYLAFCLTDIHRLNQVGYGAFFVSLSLLAYTLISGLIGIGARRWISLYFFRMQPAELIKLFLPAFLAFHCITPLASTASPTLKQLLFPAGMLSITTLLVLKQPDLGTALLIFFTGIIIFWIAGIDKRLFMLGALIVALASPILWKTLKPYQQQRILTLLGQGETHKERYQIEQSRIAIGSGRLLGKGFLRGTQNKFAFLPEDHTDFIFAVICEEWGFAGASLVIMLLCCLFMRIVYVLTTVSDMGTQLVGIGLLSHIMLSTIINIGMVTGIMPTTGIPLPLFSYGPSNLLVTLASLGWLNNIAIRRRYY